MEKYDNKVLLQGIIIRKSVTEKMGSLILETTKMGEKKRNYNTPCVYFFEPMIKELDNYQLGDFVTIEGEMQAFKDKKSRKKKQSVVAKKISPAESRIKQIYNVGNSSLIEKKNQVQLLGTVLNIQDASSVWNIFLRVVSEGHVHPLLVKLFKVPATKNVLESIQPGDTVCVMGTIQTKKQKKEERTLYYENIVAMEVVKFAEKAESA